MTVMDRVLSKLPGWRRDSNGYRAFCPIHQAHHDPQSGERRSLSLKEKNDGTILVYCFRGCTFSQIMGAINMEESECFGDDRPSITFRLPKRISRPVNITPRPAVEFSTEIPKPQKLYDTAEAALSVCCDNKGNILGKPDQIFYYLDANGTPVGAVGRWNIAPKVKHIRQVNLQSGGWAVGAMGKPRPLYNLPDVIEAVRSGQTIDIVEGEKVADAANNIGIVATTSMGGVNGHAGADWEPLRGATVRIWPDKDEPGEKYALAVLKILRNIGATARIVRPFHDILKDKQDLADWIERQIIDEPDMPLATIREEVERSCDLYMGKYPDEAVVDSSESIATVNAECIEAEADDDDDDGGEVESPPFPIDSLPPIIRDYVKQCADGIYPYSYIALPIIASLSSLLCGKRRVWITRRWKPDPIFWPIVVAESGSKKSVAHRDAMDELVRINMQYGDDYKSALSKYQQDQKTRDKSDPSNNSQRPKRKRVYCTDATTEGILQAMNDSERPLLLSVDELNTWFESFTRYRTGGGSDMSNWLGFYEARPAEIARKDTTKDVSFNRAAVNVCGTIQPSVLAASLLKPSFVGSGFLARCLFSFEPAIEDEQYDDEPQRLPLVNSDRFCQFTRRLEALPYPYSGVEPFELQLTRETLKLFNDYRRKHIADLKREALAMPENSLHREYWKSFVEKHREHPIRLVPLFHAAECIGTDPRADDLDKPISCETMERAIEVAKWFAHGAKKLCRMIADQPANYRQERVPLPADEYVLAGIKEGEEITARELQRRRQRYKRKSDLLVILNTLIASGQIVSRTVTDEKNRPSILYRLA